MPSLSPLDLDMGLVRLESIRNYIDLQSFKEYAKHIPQIDPSDVDFYLEEYLQMEEEELQNLEIEEVKKIIEGLLLNS